MDENPSFYKIMFPIPRLSKQLQIPPEFVEHIDKCAYKEAALKDGSGSIWPVKLYKNTKGVFVKEGWEQFFEDHSLGNLEFVTFTYDGETSFNVTIFGKDGLRSLYQTQDDTSNGSLFFELSLEDENNSERDEVYNAPEVVPVNGRRKRGRPRKNPPPNSQLPISRQGKGQDVPNRRSNEFGVNKSFRKNTNEVEIIESAEEEITFRLKDIENEEIYQSHEYMNMIVKANGTIPNVEKKKRGRPFGSKNKKKGQGLGCDEPESSKKLEKEKGLSIEIKNEIVDLCDDETCFGSKKLNLREANNNFFPKHGEFRSKFPFFEICIDLDDLNQDKKFRISIPRTFVRKHFSNIEKTVIRLIGENGKSWEVTLNHSAYRFYGGWVSFMRDNELKHGDRCIFELVKAKEMKVYIYRS